MLPETQHLVGGGIGLAMEDWCKKILNERTEATGAGCFLYLGYTPRYDLRQL